MVQRQALQFSSPTAFLTHLLHNTTLPKPSPTHKNLLIVCQSRNDFIHHLLADVDASTSASFSDHRNNEYGDADGHDLHINTNSQKLTLLSSPFITAPITLVAAASKFMVTYAPTLMHLRAILATLHTSTSSSPSTATTSAEETAAEKVGPQVVAIYGILNLHRESGELTAQGLSRTLAALVDYTYSFPGNHMSDVELKEGFDGEKMVVIQVEEINEKIPIVNSDMMMKRNFLSGDGFDEEGEKWKVAVEKVVERWFEIVTIDHRGDDQDKEML